VAVIAVKSLTAVDKSGVHCFQQLSMMPSRQPWDRRRRYRKGVTPVFSLAQHSSRAMSSLTETQFANMLLTALAILIIYALLGIFLFAVYHVREWWLERSENASRARRCPLRSFYQPWDVLPLSVPLTMTKDEEGRGPFCDAGTLSIVEKNVDVPPPVHCAWCQNQLQPSYFIPVCAHTVPKVSYLPI